MERQAVRHRRGEYLCDAQRNHRPSAPISPRARPATSPRCAHSTAWSMPTPPTCIPLEGGGWIETVNLTADQKTPTRICGALHGRRARLAYHGAQTDRRPQFYRGRNRQIEPTATYRRRAASSSRRHWPRKLFPRGNALGQADYLSKTTKPVADHRHRRSPAGPDDRRHRFCQHLLRRILVLAPVSPDRRNQRSTWCACSRGSSMPS